MLYYYYYYYLKLLLIKTCSNFYYLVALIWFQYTVSLEIFLTEKNHSRIKLLQKSLSKICRMTKVGFPLLLICCFVINYLIVFGNITTFSTYLLCFIISQILNMTLLFYSFNQYLRRNILTYVHSMDHQILTTQL